ncbi:MAG: EAL domain-containing protein, partial [Henriciella sp.]
KRFIPVFQPKIDLRTGRIVGAEALARWKLESGRIVSPNVFIPVAESTGLIGEIGAQITRQACRAAARWHRLGFMETSVAVNVSPLQFESDDLGAMIINAITEAGLPPRLLQLEITESVAVSDPQRLKDMIGPLKTMGVKLAIDDFGTGHSNLAMLGRLPFDVFKIDRAFISGLYTDKQAPAIVEMILGMAETLGMETVAEGVESEAQEAFLRRRGCDQYQGYFYSPPVSIEKFIEQLVADRDKYSANAS